MNRSMGTRQRPESDSGGDVAAGSVWPVSGRRLDGPMSKLCLTQNPEADRLLEDDPFALLIGMLLDQQIHMPSLSIPIHWETLGNRGIGGCK